MWLREGGFEKVLHVTPLALTILLFGVLGLSEWTRARRQERFVVTAQELRQLAWPSWCTEAMARRIAESLPFEPQYYSTDRNATARIAAAYKQSSWVRRVHYVRKAYPNRIAAAVELRQPVLAVPFATQYYLVDRDGVRLPVQYPRWPVDEVQVPVLTGIRPGPPPAHGVWQDAAVLDALAVLAAVEQCDEIASIRITEVDLSNLHGRIDPRQSEIVLVTDTQSRILWGRSPRTAAFGEHPVEEKVSKLGELLRQNPRPRRVDLIIRFADGGVVPN